MSTPDPSQPDRFVEMIDARIDAYLSNPIRLPEQFNSWLAQFVQLNVGPTGATIPDDNITKPPGP